MLAAKQMFAATVKDLHSLGVEFKTAAEHGTALVTVD
jgi:hypothetical protein